LRQERFSVSKKTNIVTEKQDEDKKEEINYKTSEVDFEKKNCDVILSLNSGTVFSWWLFQNFWKLMDQLI